MSIRSVARSILTNLAIVLPVALVSEAAHATMQCPSGLALYGEWAGGFWEVLRAARDSLNFQSTCTSLVPAEKSICVSL